MGMRLSLGTFSWFNHTIEKAIELTAKLGYEGVEIQGNRPRLLPTDYSAQEIAAIGNKLHEYNLQCACVTAFDGTHFWCLSSPSTKVYRDTIQHVKDCVKLADVRDTETFCTS